MMQFTSKAITTLKGLIAVIAVVLSAGHSRAATMTTETLAAWNGYVQRSQAYVAQQSSDADHFLWIERRQQSLESVQLRNGLSIYSPRDGGIPVPSGLVHYWIGTVFIPNAHVAELVNVLQDYGAYAAIYNPGVIQSKLLSHDRNDFTYRLEFAQKGFGIKAGLLGDFKSTYYRLTPEVGYSITQATALTEVANVGAPREHPLTFEDSHGYVEKVFTIVRYRQVDGGIYVEVETLTLSRDIPAPIRWAVAPLIRRFSRQTMADTLERLRSKVQNTRTLEAATNNSFIASARGGR